MIFLSTLRLAQGLRFSTFYFLPSTPHWGLDRVSNFTPTTTRITAPESVLGFFERIGQPDASETFPALKETVFSLEIQEFLCVLSDLCCEKQRF